MSVRIALSSRAAAEVERSLLELARPDRAPTMGDFVAMEATLASALARWPGNAHAMELVGRSSNLRADLRIDRDPNTRQALRGQARDALRQATALRPAWPYAHAELALVKASAGEFDAELATAVARARRLGANEPRVLRQLTQVWLRGADLRLPALRAPLTEALDDPRSGLTAAFVDRADRGGRAQALCLLPALGGSARTRCRQLGWTVSGESAP